MGMMCSPLFLCWSEPVGCAWLPTCQSVWKHSHTHTGIFAHTCGNSRVDESVSSSASQRWGGGRSVCLRWSSHLEQATMNHSCLFFKISTRRQQMTHIIYITVFYFHANVSSGHHQPTHAPIIIYPFVFFVCRPSFAHCLCLAFSTCPTTRPSIALLSHSPHVCLLPCPHAPY